MPPIAKQESQSGLQVIGPRRDNSSEPIDVYMGRLVQMSNELPTYLSDMQVNKIRNNPGADVSWYVLDKFPGQLFIAPAISRNTLDLYYAVLTLSISI